MKGIIREVAMFAATLSCGMWVSVSYERALQKQTTHSKTDSSQSEIRQRAEAERRLSDELAVVNSYKVGMTRAQLLEWFTPAMGLSSASSGSFDLRTNSCIKVDVRFSVTKDLDGRAVSGGDDQIIRISRPYLDCRNMG